MIHQPLFAIVILGAFTIAALVGAVRSGLRRRERQRRLQALRDGAIAVTGTVARVDEPLIAPLSGRACVAYRASARTYRRTAAGGTTVRDEFVEHHMVPFTLATDDGEIEVRGTACELAMRPEPVIPRKLERERRFLAARTAEEPHGAGFDEIAIQPGMKIVVHGARRGRELSGDDASPLLIDRA